MTISLRALLSATAIGLAHPAVVLAQSTEPQPAPTEPTRLKGVTVTDTAIEGFTIERPVDEGYKADRSLTATKTDTPLIDVPQSISVVTHAQIEDQAIESMADAIRYVPGVSFAQGEGNRDTPVLRGNSTTADFFVDGIRDDVQYYRDTYNIERVEVLKGPNAMIFGRGGVGGVINRVTRQANWDEIREVRLEAGMYDHYRSTFDLGQPLSDTVAVRLTGLYQNSDSYRDDVDDERWGVNPTASFKLGEDTLLQLGYEHFIDKRVADRGIPSFGNRPLKTDRSTFFGDPANSPVRTNVDAVTLAIEHRFSDAVSLRNRIRYADYDKFYQNVFPGAVAQNAAGQPTTVAITAYNNRTDRENFINQTDLNASFATGGVAHTVLAGAEIGRQDTDNLRQTGFFPGGAASINVPVTAPNIRTPVTWRPIASDANNSGVAHFTAVYLQDQIEFAPWIQAILGLRYDRFEIDFRDQRTAAPVHFEVTDKLWSPRAGVVLKPIETASIYASYSRTTLPRSGEQLGSLNLSNAALAPEKFQNYEIGAKWDITPDLNLTAALYRLDRSNVIVLIDPNNAGAGTTLGGGQRTKGFELGLTGNITDQLSVVAAYAYQDGEFTKAISASVQEGNRLANLPKHSASLWTRYDITPNLGIGLGVTHQSKRYAATDNQVTLPAYTRFDAALFYDISENLRAQLNVENLFNAKYYPFANSNNNITPGAPITARASLAVRF